MSRDGKIIFSSELASSDLLVSAEKLTLKKLKALANQLGANGNTAIYWADAKGIREFRINNSTRR
ncbi:MAG: hypothetical protein OEW18_00490 [Candidatus Aminicenantes bacterium]|nr:hypothetical protein [Candidatus Aminicenantes bacterium]